ncbi:hypothetical protein BH11BAC2_BH11BAC2_09030 [soil metagenome]
MEDPNLKDRSTWRFYWLPVILMIPLIWIICRLTGFNGLYGQDSHEYLRYSKAIASFLTGGTEPGSFFWPVGYPVITAFVSFLVPDILSLQFVSLISAAVCFIFFCKTLKLLYPEGTQRQRYAIFLLFCSPFFIRAAITGMSDMLCCAFLSIFFYYLLIFDRKQEGPALLLAVFAGIMAIQTRYIAGVFLLPLIPACIPFLKKQFSLLLIAAAIGIFTFSPSFFLRAQENFAFLHHPWVKNWSLLYLFQFSFNTQEGAFSYTFPNILYVLALIFHPGFCFPAGLLLFFSFKRKSPVPKWWIVSLILFLVYLAGIPFQNMRFLLPGLPLLLLFLYPGFEVASSYIKNRTSKLIILTVIFGIQMGLTYRAIRPFYQYQQEEYIVASELKHQPNRTLYTFSIDGALHTYSVQQEIVNIWNNPDAIMESESLFLYNPNRFNRQYKDTPPGKIYRKLRVEGRLISLKSLPNGWELYRIR